MTDTYVPKWFSRELSYIDPTYYVRKDNGSRLYQIMKDAEIYYRFKDGTTICYKQPRAVDQTPFLNDAILNKLRYRKWLGRHMKIVENPDAEKKAMLAEEAEQKEKAMEESNEMLAKGAMEYDSLINKRKQSWSYKGA